MLDWLSIILKPLFAGAMALRLVVFVSDVPLVLAADTQVQPIGVQTAYAKTEPIQLTNVFSPTEFLVLTNEARTAFGDKPLNLNTDLDNAALAKAEDMVVNHYWAHFRPSDHKAPWDFIQESGYNYTVAGENLARGFRTPAGITNAWLNSPPHRANMLSPKYNDVGFACVWGTDDSGNPVLLTVQMFGSR